MNANDIRQITAQVMADKRLLPVIIAVKDVWPIVVAIKYAAGNTDLPSWTRKSWVAIAKRFEKIVRAMHPNDNTETLEGLEPILLDASLITVNVTFCEAWQILTIVQACVGHPDFSDTMKQLTVPIARQLQERIVEDHPYAYELAAMGWNPRY